ncbi:MAG: alpha/beta fold hydrolase [Actinomycetes bacterium]
MCIVERPTAVAPLRAGPVEYRLDRRGDDTVLVFHGGHMRASLPLGETIFEELGYSVLAPSRPGYGKTPLHPDSSPEGFAMATAELCAQLGVQRLAAVLAMSAGGRTGLAMAANYPDLVPRLILEGAVGFEPWPASGRYIGAKVLFNPVWERVVWALVHSLMRWAPSAGLRVMMRSLSTEPAAQAVDGLSEHERATLAGLFARMRSGCGFVTDLDFARRPMAVTIAQPVLVIASRGDKAVPLTQAESLKERLDRATLMLADTSSHFLWFGPGSGEVADQIRMFLRDGG